MRISTSVTYTPAELSAIAVMDAMSDVLIAANAAGDTDGHDAHYFRTWQQQGPADNPGYYGRVHNVLADMIHDFCEVTGLRAVQPDYGPFITDPTASAVEAIMTTSLDQQRGERITAALAYLIRAGEIH